jgi:hypothetical protein
MRREHAIAAVLDFGLSLQRSQSKTLSELVGAAPKLSRASLAHLGRGQATRVDPRRDSRGEVRGWNQGDRRLHRYPLVLLQKGQRMRLPRFHPRHLTISPTLHVDGFVHPTGFIECPSIPLPCPVTFRVGFGANGRKLLTLRSDEFLYHTPIDFHAVPTTISALEPQVPFESLPRARMRRRPERVLRPWESWCCQQPTVALIRRG